MAALSHKRCPLRVVLSHLAVGTVLWGCPSDKASAKLSDQGATPAFEHPPVDPMAAPRTSGRLTVRQLADSMPVALGGSTWMIGNAKGFDARRATLGDPDYLAVVDESGEPSALFLKFMGDAARDGCARALKLDVVRPANQRSVIRFSGLSDTAESNRAAVDENLRYLKLRFHGARLEPGDDAALSGLRALFSTAVQGLAAGHPPTSEHVAEGWKAVCVALLTAPEYHLY
jgi:hypothetical protein